MNRTWSFALLLISLTFLDGQLAHAFRQAVTPPSGQPIVLKLSDLRSAYLLRAGIVHYDAAAMSPNGIRTQIQRHFDVVLGLLVTTTPHSIETALDRLAAATDASWSMPQRNQLRRQLLVNRYTQLMRLAAYRDRGLFPQNKGQASSAVPIFVDRQDTACAVGHLMQISDWRTAVARIQRANNLVYVSDARDSDVTRWVLRSGLTLEEAALIQPGYPFIVTDLMSQFSPGGSALVQDGLRYENFQVVGSNFINPPTNVDPSVCRSNPSACLGSPTAGGVLPNAAHIGLRAGAGTHLEATTGNYIDPVGTHWIGIGGVFPNFTPALINGLAPVGFAQQITIQFDVSPLSADKRIDQITQHNDELEGGFSSFSFSPPPTDANYVMISRVLANLNEIARTTLDRASPIEAEPSISGSQQVSSVNFQPQSQITVESNLYLINGVAISSFALDFNVIQVPEPGTISMCFTLIAGLLVSGARRRGRWLS